MIEGEKAYHDIINSNPFLHRNFIVDIVTEYGSGSKLEFDDDGKLPFIRCVVKFIKLLENQYSTNVEIETENHFTKVMHLPPLHRLENLTLKKELMLGISLGPHKIVFQNANQPKILFLDDFDLTNFWEFSNSKKVCILLADEIV